MSLANHPDIARKIVRFGLAASAKHFAETSGQAETALPRAAKNIATAANTNSLNFDADSLMMERQMAEDRKQRTEDR